MYKEIYENILNYRTKNPLYKTLKDGTIHVHHITQRYNGGGNEDSNLILLTIREHKIIHWLLWKINGHINDLLAYNRLGGSSKLTPEAKAFLSKINKERYNNLSLEKKQEIINRIANCLKGPRTEKHCLSLSRAKKARGIWSGDKNPFHNSARFGELNPMHGKKHSLDSKLKMSSSSNISDSRKQEISDWAKTRTLDKNSNSKSVTINNKFFKTRIEAYEYFGVGAKTICTWVKRYGVEISPNDFKIIISKTSNKDLKGKWLDKI